MAVVSKTTVSASSTTSAFILCKKKASFLLTEFLEEGRGFEPLSLTGQRFSRPPHYLTLPTFLGGRGRIRTYASSDGRFSKPLPSTSRPLYLGWAGRNRTFASRFKRPLHRHSATTQDGPVDILASHHGSTMAPSKRLIGEQGWIRTTDVDLRGYLVYSQVRSPLCHLPTSHVPG